MTSIDTDIETDDIFQAKWLPPLQPFDQSPQNEVQKIIQIVYNIFSFLFPPLGLVRLAYTKLQQFSAGQCLLVSQLENGKKRKIRSLFDQYWFGDITEHNRLIRSCYTAKKFSAKTPDLVSLEGTFLQHCSSSSTTPTVLVFQGNGSMSSQNEVSMFLYTAAKTQKVVNFLIFDYRGVNPDSPLPKNTNDFLIDTDTIYQYAINHFQIHTLHTFGFSLGGGISLIWRTLHPELKGRCVVDRSFSSTMDVAYEQLPSGLGFLVSRIGKFLGWNIPSVEAWKKISARKLCVFSKDDPIIPYSCSLHKKLSAQNKITDLESLELTVEGYQGANHHILSPHLYKDQHGKNAWERVCNFLFTSSEQAK